MTVRASIRSQLEQWAIRRSLAVQRQRHQDVDASAVPISDDAGDVFQFFAGPDPQDPLYPNSKNAFVGVSLVKRGSKKHHALSRERSRYTFTKLISPVRIEEGLEEAWLRLEEWVSEAGHRLPSA